jgi:hypothetical protein
MSLAPKWAWISASSATCRCEKKTRFGTIGSPTIFRACDSVEATANSFPKRPSLWPLVSRWLIENFYGCTNCE